jgi:predicted DCC family thiol-disulfide oxidoreductase YuxK
MITVFYDGKCPLCSREINYYRKIAPPQIFEWKEIRDSGEDLKKEGISLSQALKRLHVKDQEGKFHVGVDAFVLIWKQLKYWWILALVIKLPIIWQMATIAYKVFADWRFKRLGYLP